MPLLLRSALLVIILGLLPLVAIPADGKEAALNSAESKNQSLNVPEDIGKLLAKAKFQYYELGELSFADSLASMAVRKAERSFDPDLLLFTLNEYLSMNEMGYDRTKAASYAKKAEELASQTSRTHLAWTTYTNLATVYLDIYDFDKATAFSYKALTIAESENDDALRARSYLVIGSTLQQNNQNLEAFRYFLNALTLAESGKVSSILTECYKTLAQFYNINKVYDKAVQFKMKQIDLIRATEPIDSTALVWAMVDLEEIGANSNNEVHEDKIIEIIAYAEAHRNSFLKQYVLAGFRSYLIDNGMFERLRQLYTVDYPEELNYLKGNLPGIYFRLRAIFSELDKDLESALYFLQRADSLMTSDGNAVMKSNFYIRFGEFYQRHGKNREAAAQFEKGFENAMAASYFEFSLKAARALVGIHKDLGNFERALYFSELSRGISDSIAQMNRKDEMLHLELQNAAQRSELEREAQVIETRHRNNIQYSFIVLMILLSFVILILLGSFKVSARMIHFLGFLSFIFLFEFIILLADGYIHHATHGEPLKIMGIKIVLIAFLLPLHHWIEKKVTHSLIHRRLIRVDKASWRTAIAGLRNTAREIWAKWD